MKKCLRAPLFSSQDATPAKHRALSLLQFPNIDKYGRKISLLPCLEYTTADLGSDSENQTYSNNNITVTNTAATTNKDMDVVSGEDGNTETAVFTDSSIRKHPITENPKDFVDDQCFSLNLSYLPGTPHTAGTIFYLTLIYIT